MSKNIYELQNCLDSARASLKDATEKLDKSFKDNATSIADRNALQDKVNDFKNRVEYYENQIREIEAENKAKLDAENEAKTIAAAQTVNKIDEAKATIIKNKANGIRNIVNGDKTAGLKNFENVYGLGASYQIKNTLSDNPSTGQGGGSFIPKTTSNEVITEPVYENDLRSYIKISNESNLEKPRLLFSVDDDGFVLDEATAKEIKANGDTVVFGRNKSKLKVKVSETILLGSDTNLVDTVDSGLEGAAAFKEVKQLFALPSASYYKANQSFYANDGASSDPQPLIINVTDSTMFGAIKKAITKLPKMFRKNAKIVMAQSDYYDILSSLANGNASFFLAPPESILGKPVIFMDEAEGAPIIGDLNYLQINYHPDTIYDNDKDIDSGINMFVLTKWYDIQFLLRSAFRIAKVSSGN